MVQPAQDLRFVAEALEKCGRGEAGADHLEGDGAARVVLLGLVDGAHAPFAKQSNETILPSRLGSTGSLNEQQVIQEVLSRDNRLRERTAADLMNRANAILDDLDDLAVLVLFSVFEVTVRDRAKADVDRETASIQHPAVLRAVKDLKEAIENGSFGRVTESYKSMDVDSDRAGQPGAEVPQLGRPWPPWRTREFGGAQAAIDRLRRYLARLEEVEKAATMGLLPDAPEPEAASEPE